MLTLIILLVVAVWGLGVSSLYFAKKADAQWLEHQRKLYETNRVHISKD